VFLGSPTWARTRDLRINRPLSGSASHLHTLRATMPERRKRTVLKRDVPSRALSLGFPREGGV